MNEAEQAELGLAVEVVGNLHRQLMHAMTVAHEAEQPQVVDALRPIEEAANTAKLGLDAEMIAVLRESMLV